MPDAETEEKDYVPTDAQKRWWKRLQRVMRDMPKSVELLVADGQIEMTYAGETDAFFNAKGHVDGVENLSAGTIFCTRIKDVGSRI